MTQPCLGHLSVYLNAHPSQAECGVALNTVENADAFIADVRAGRWEAVLPSLGTLTLPRPLMEDLYEQIVLELVEQQEGDAARPLLRQAAVFQAMQRDTPKRYARLDRLCAGGSESDSSLWGEGSSKSDRREVLCRSLCSEVKTIPASRLMAVVGQAIKWQQSQGLIPEGARYDLFRGTVVDEEEDASGKAGRVVGELDRNIKFGAKSHPESAFFSPDGLSLATGSADGFIELWDPRTAKLRKDLIYQAEERFMVHDTAVLALYFSADSQLLVSGSVDGQAKLWRVATGACVRRFDGAHEGGVTSVAISSDNSQILTAGYDGLIRVHGVKSGRALKEFRGHTSFVNSAVFLHRSGNGSRTTGIHDGDSRVLSCSADGTVRVWDAKTCECMAAFRPPSTGADASIERVYPLPGRSDTIIVQGRRHAVYVMTLAGQVVRTLDPNKKEGADGSGSALAGKGGQEASTDPNEIVGSAASPHGDWIYVVTEGGKLHAFEAASGKLESTIEVADKGAVIGVAHHPRRSLLATWTEAGVLSLWKPEQSVS